MSYQGIDVAKWQGSINWAKVGAEGVIEGDSTPTRAVDFAILKVTNKSNATEGAFEANYVGARSAGILTGGYRYVYALTVAAAETEARAIVANLQGKTMEMGIWLDMEDSALRALSKAQLTAIIEAEAAIIKAAGFSVGIYCNRDWYYNVLDGAGLASKYIFWIARYPKTDKGVYTESSSLNPKAYAKAWQYSSKGTVSGIDANTDLDMAFINIPEYFGTVEAASVKEYYPKYTGTSGSIKVALAAVGETDVSFEHRRQIAAASGVVTSARTYTGSAAQNTLMVSKLKAGILVKA